MKTRPSHGTEAGTRRALVLRSVPPISLWERLGTVSKQHPNVPRGMGLTHLAKNAKAIKELTDKGMAPN
jgi:hypothetical protein